MLNSYAIVSGAGDTPTNANYLFALPTINSKNFWVKVPVMNDGTDLYVVWSSDASGKWVLGPIPVLRINYSSSGDNPVAFSDMVVNYYSLDSVGYTPNQAYTAVSGASPAPTIALQWNDDATQSATPLHLISNSVIFTNSVTQSATLTDTPPSVPDSGSYSVFGLAVFGGGAFADFFIPGSSTSNAELIAQETFTHVATIVQEYAQTYYDSISQAATLTQSEVIGWNSTTTHTLSVNDSNRSAANYVYVKFDSVTASHNFRTTLVAIEHISQVLTATQSEVVASGLIIVQLASIAQSNTFVHNKFAGVTQNLVVTDHTAIPVYATVTQNLSVTNSNISVAYTVYKDVAAITDSNSVIHYINTLVLTHVNVSYAQLSTVDTSGYNRYYALAETGDTALEGLNLVTEFS